MENFSTTSRPKGNSIKRQQFPECQARERRESELVTDVLEASCVTFLINIYKKKRFLQILKKCCEIVTSNALKDVNFFFCVSSTSTIFQLTTALGWRKDFLIILFFAYPPLI